MLHLFYGSDDFSCAHAAAALLQSLLGEDTAYVYVSRQEGAAVSWQALREACFTVSMFSPVHVLQVNGLLGSWTGRAEGSAKAGNRPSPEEFRAFTAQLPPSTHLVLVEGALTSANRYLKALAGAGPEEFEIRAFQGLDEREIERWIANNVRERGGTIDSDAAAELAARVGQDLRQLSGEIDKLLAYSAPERRISAQAVDLLVVRPDGANAFHLIDAVCAKHAPKAVDLVQRLLEHGEAPEAILALLGGRIRDVAMLHAASADGIADSTVLQDTGWKPYRLKQLQESRRAFTAQEVLDSQAVLVAADAALKSRPTHERPTIILLTVLSIAQRKGLAELEAALPL